MTVLCASLWRVDIYFRSVNRKYLSIGLLATVLGAGCTQQGKTAQSNKDRTYYHDRRTGLGTNIPRSYSDSASANQPDARQSDIEQEQFQQTQQQNASIGAAQGAGGR